MHTELALIVLSATILVALSQLQRQRPALLRQPQQQRRPRGVREELQRPSTGSGLAGQVAWAGMATATVACLGHFAAPVADPFWLALLAAAIASVPVALVAPPLEARRRCRRRQREGDSRAEVVAMQEQRRESEQHDRGVRDRVS